MKQNFLSLKIISYGRYCLCGAGFLILINKYFEENPSNLAPDAEYSFTFCLESIPPIKIQVFTKDSEDAEDYYSAFAECGRKITILKTGDFLDKVIEDALFEILSRSYYVSCETDE